VNPVFYGLAILEAQIVQETRETLRVRVVPAAGFDARQRRTIEERLGTRMGPVRVQFETCDSIERGSNGKFRAVVCRLPTESGTPPTEAVRS